MKSINNYINLINTTYKIEVKDIIEDGAKLIGMTLRINSKIEFHKIIRGDFDKLSKAVIKEIKKYRNASDLKIIK